MGEAATAVLALQKIGADTLVLQRALRALSTRIEAVNVAPDKAAQEALRLAPLAVDATIRNLALEQARDALKAVAAAAARWANAQLTVAQTSLKDTQKTVAVGASTKRSELVADYRTGGTSTMGPAALAAEVDKSRKGISDSAKAWRSAFALNDPTVGAARDAALAAAAEAAVPGASRLARIPALEKARDADKALSGKALEEANNAVAGLPVAPPSTDSSNTPLSTNSASAFRDANARFEAANASAGKWRESAQAVVEAVRIALAELDAIAAPTTAESDDKVAVAARSGDADTALTSAIERQQLFKSSDEE